jgi:hypothetical protein
MLNAATFSPSMINQQSSLIPRVNSKLDIIRQKIKPRTIYSMKQHMKFNESSEKIGSIMSDIQSRHEVFYIANKPI